MNVLAELSRKSTTLKREANVSSLLACSEVIVLFLTVRMKLVIAETLESLMIRARKNVVNLTSRLSKHGVMSPRFDVQLKDLEHGKIVCSYHVSLVLLH